jgi:hypothetical protein
MVLQKLLHSLRHFGRLGRVASNRGFLRREKRKLLLKLGDKAYHLMEQGAIEEESLAKIAAQVKKIQVLLDREDYGGDGGVDFSGPAKKSPDKRK